MTSFFIGIIKKLLYLTLAGVLSTAVDSGAHHAGGDITVAIAASLALVIAQYLYNRDNLETHNRDNLESVISLLL